MNNLERNVDSVWTALLSMWLPTQETVLPKWSTSWRSLGQVFLRKRPSTAQVGQDWEPGCGTRLEIDNFVSREMQASRAPRSATSKWTAAGDAPESMLCVLPAELVVPNMMWVPWQVLNLISLPAAGSNWDRFRIHPRSGPADFGMHLWGAWHGGFSCNDSVQWAMPSTGCGASKTAYGYRPWDWDCRKCLRNSVAEVVYQNVVRTMPTGNWKATKLE